MTKRTTAHANVNQDNLDSLRRQALVEAGQDASKYDASEIKTDVWNGPSDVYLVDIEGSKTADDGNRITLWGAIRSGLSTGPTHAGERLLATFYLAVTRTGKRVGLQRLLRQLNSNLNLAVTTDRLDTLNTQVETHLVGKAVQVAHNHDNGRGYPDDEFLCWPKA